jgi:ABC-2 type transport system permease protein
MTAIGMTLRNELIGLGGIVERNVYLTKRYFLWDVAFMLWTIANTLTIVFIARAVHVPPAQENTLATKLLVGAVIWAFLGIIFEFMTETVAWERWEGTIEYTFMAPISRAMHLWGQGAFAVLYGLIRATILFFAVALFIGIHMPHANFAAAFGLLAIASLSFIGMGMMTSVLPLISPEKGAQLGFIAQGLMLVVSGVYSRCCPQKTPRGKGLEASFSLGASRGTTDGSASDRLRPTQTRPKGPVTHEARQGSPRAVHGHNCPGSSSRLSENQGIG